MDKLVLAYLAGVMDSDGFISIRRTAPSQMSPDSFTYSEFTGVGQVQPDAVALFQERFGGTIKIRVREGHDNWRPLHYWVVTNKLAAACVEALRPYLRVKARNADLVLALRASKNLPASARRTTAGEGRVRFTNPDVVAERHRLYEEIRSLNDTRRRA